MNAGGDRDEAGERFRHLPHHDRWLIHRLCRAVTRAPSAARRRAGIRRDLRRPSRRSPGRCAVMRSLYVDRRGRRPAAAVRPIGGLGLGGASR